MLQCRNDASGIDESLKQQRKFRWRYFFFFFFYPLRTAELPGLWLRYTCNAYVWQHRAYIRKIVPAIRIFLSLSLLAIKHFIHNSILSHDTEIYSFLFIFALIDIKRNFTFNLPVLRFFTQKILVWQFRNLGRL